MFAVKDIPDQLPWADSFSVGKDWQKNNSANASVHMQKMWINVQRFTWLLEADTFAFCVRMERKGPVGWFHYQ